MGTRSIPVYNPDLGSLSAPKPDGTLIALLGSLFTNGVSTTDATPTAALSVAVPSNKGICGTLLVSGRNTSTNKTANTVLQVSAQNISGTVAVLGTPFVALTVALGSDAAMTACVVSVAGSGANMVVTVTGIVATNITWTATFVGQVN